MYKLLNNKAVLFWSALLLFLYSCNIKYLKYTPLPNKNLSLTNQINYLIKTDQQDRKSNYLRFVLFPNNKHILNVASRDSIRCNYLLNLIKDSTVIISNDKFNCGILFMHGDGNVDCTDTLILHLSTTFFLDLKNNPKSKGDSLNGITWFKLSNERYQRLLKKCK